MPEFRVIPDALLSDLLKYLDTRPYREVAGLVGILEKLPTAKITKPAETEEEDGVSTDRS